MQKSIIEYFPQSDVHRCGYCKKPDSSCTRGMWAHLLTVQDYQSLIDRGWRRSGLYCYKPTMDETCCPMYTIKCDALNFKLTKSQKKILKRMNKYLVNGDNVSDMDGKEGTNVTNNCHSDTPTSSQDEAVGDNDVMMEMANKEHKKVDIRAIKMTNNTPNVNVLNTSDSEKPAGPGPSSDDISKIPCKKAKQIRIERKKNKLESQGIQWNPDQNKPALKNTEKSLEEFLDFMENIKDLKIKLVRSSPPSSEWMATSDASYKLYCKYQQIIHNDPIDKLSEKQYRRFLVNSPLQEYSPKDDIPTGYGSFHQQYWLKDELIAVGVIDILPHCVSSVYFYYDPSYSHLSLGTFGALQEIAFTRSLQKVSSNIKYYYLGYYIHSCQKMRYKGNFSPSYLLCPETYQWFPIEKCCPKLDASPYSRLNPDIDQLDSDSCNKNDVGDIYVLIGNTYSRFNQCKQSLRGSESSKSNIEKHLLEYGNLVGKKCTQTILYVLQ